MKKITLLFGLMTFWLAFGFSQEKPLTLQGAINMGLQNNLILKQNENSRLTAVQNKRQSIEDFAPNLNGNINYGQDIGKGIVDNFSFSTTKGRVSSSAGISSSLDIFNGLSRYYTLKQRQNELSATEFALLKIRNDITSTVVLYYFQVVFDMENLKIIENRRQLVQNQIGRAEKQLKAGLITEGDVLALRAQGATENLNSINQKNQLEKDKLNLIQYINLDPNQAYAFGLPEVQSIEVSETMPGLESIYRHAVSTMPEMKEAELRIKASEFAMKSARGSYYPSLSFNASWNTWYSSTNKNRPIIGYDSTFGVVYPVYGDPQNIPLFTQYEQNNYFRVGFSLNIPIYNRYQVRRSVELAKINIDNARLSYENQKQILEKKIQQAYLDLSGSYLRYEASVKQLESAQTSFSYIEKKFTAGSTDFYNFREGLNNLSRAENELMQARYDYLLKSKILDIYQGKPLKF